MNPKLVPLMDLPDTFERRLAFVALLGEELAARGAPRPVVVGEHALEVCLGGATPSRVVEIVARDPLAVDRACAKLGLSRAGACWMEAELGLALRCSSPLVPARVIELELHGMALRVAAVEEGTCSAIELPDEPQVIEHLSLDQLRRRAVERYPVLVARTFQQRATWQARDADEVAVLIALAVADWRRGERDGKIRRLPDGRLSFERGIFGPGSVNPRAT